MSSRLVILVAHAHGRAANRDLIDKPLPEDETATTMGQPYDWRDEPSRFSLSSLVLLLVFVGAVGLTVYVAFQMKPWASDEPAPPEVSSDVQTDTAAGELTPVPAEGTPAP